MEPKFHRIKLEDPLAQKLYQEQQAIEAEHGIHPYLYPAAIKATWLYLNKAILNLSKEL